MPKPKRGRPAAAKSREELRRENRQALEQKKHRRNALMIIVLVALTVAVAVILSLTVFFKISAIEVDASDSQYSAEQIRDASGLQTGENLFLVDRAQVSDRISQQLPYTGEITVKRNFPNKIKIFVEDSSILAAVRYNDEFILLNESNKVLAKAGTIDTLNTLVERQNTKMKARAAKKAGTKTTTTTTSTTSAETTTTTATSTTTGVSEETTTENMEEIAGGEDLRNATDQVTVITGVKVKRAKVGYPLEAKNKEVFETYKEIRTAMDHWGVKEITAVDLTKLSDIRLTYQKRITILLGSASGLDKKAAMCAKVLEEQDKVSKEQKGTIDLSIEGKAYFSEGGATTRTTTTTTTTVPTVSEPMTGVTETTVPVTDENGQVVTTTAGASAPTDAATSTTANDLADTGG